jgi:cell division protease FtsH
MIALLAGRAAEEIVYGEVSTGAADDLTKATDIARQSVTRFGMSDKVGQAALKEERQQWLGDGSRLHPKDYSEATAREVDLAIRGIIDEAYASAKDLLRSRSMYDFPPLLRREGTATFPKVPATSD